MQASLQAAGNYASPHPDPRGARRAPSPRARRRGYGTHPRADKRAATKGDGWLTYYYTAESFARTWAKVRGYASEAGRDPDALVATNQLPICIGRRETIEAPMKHWLQTEWDYAAWSESTMDSAIIGSVEECVEQLQAHIATGVDRIIFVPYRYESEQLALLAGEVIPRLNSTA